MKTLLRSVLSLACLLPLPHGLADATDDYQVTCLYLGEDPSGETSWSDAVSGLAHDDSAWIITQGDWLDDKNVIWRVPVGYDLDSVSIFQPGVLVRNSFTELEAEEGHWQLGDPCVYRYEGRDYLLAPYDDEGGLKVGLAVLDADTLEIIDHVQLSLIRVAVSAVDQSGALYMDAGLCHIRRVTVNWATLHETGNLSVSEFGSSLDLRYESGLPFDPHMSATGLEVTPDGRYLYLVANDANNYGDPPAGIHIFDLQTGRRVQNSTNAPDVFFPFYWTPPEEVPEGLALWDLAGTGSPHWGELHVIVRERDFAHDDVFLKHYSSFLYAQYQIEPGGDGTPWNPFSRINSAVEAAWDGSELRIVSGTYAETLTIGKQVRLRTLAGVTRIGG